MTSKLPVAFHPRASDADVIDAIADYMRECHMAALPGAFRLVVERLSERYGSKLVDRALRQYERAIRQESQRLKRENQRLERNLKRQSDGL